MNLSLWTVEDLIKQRGLYNKLAATYWREKRLTQPAIGRKLGLSAGRVSQLLQHAPMVIAARQRWMAVRSECGTPRPEGT